ncbi:MAG TPA: condensation domain-containing protein, partial [Jatrophihabitans sp.]|nr:condensation domain-containing protein [Jatrophihabitans sp.]
LNAERMDISQMPLLRAELHRFDDRDAVLTILTHHSAGDGWSTGLHKRDLAALYKARTTGEPAELPEVRQYREFASWQRDRIDSERGAIARKFWQDKLADTQVFTMPSDRRNGEGVLHSPYGAANFSIPVEEVEAFEAHAISARSSSWHAILAAEALLAQRLRGRSDITLMTNVAGRAERSFNDTVGFFADFVPLRLDLDSCQTFQDVLLHSRSTCLEAMRHPLPINVIEGGLPNFTDPYDDPETLPFIFNYARPLYGPQEYQFAESVELITLRDEEPGDRGGWCIWSMLREPAGSIRGSVEYPPDLVDASTVEGWVAEFRRLLGLLCTAPNQNWKDR